MGAVSEVSFRELPSVDRLAAQLEAPHALAVETARAVIEERREELSRGVEEDGVDLLDRARARLQQLELGTLRNVLNATGVIIHTNLGRAPLAARAREAVNRAAQGYCALELDLDTGRRGSRQSHIQEVLRLLTGAEAALAVNNGAGAALLAVAALAGADGSVVVSRGQLVEIGGGFRIPEVIEQAGARLVEVGTTNRTRLEDYQRALGDLQGTASPIVLRVHASNFRTVGFTESVEIEALCGLGVPVVDDLGSGALADIPALADEPDVRRSVAAGADLACFSGDKLLGGPQAGLLVGRREAIRRAERHPLARALRVDKLSLAALEATLALYRNGEVARREIPVLAMLESSEAELVARAELILSALPRERAELDWANARVGGGALPLLELHGPVVSVDPGRAGAPALAGRLREGPVAVIGRIQHDRLLLDPRTLSDAEAEQAAGLVSRALSE